MRHLIKNYGKMYKKSGTTIALFKNDFSLVVVKSGNIGLDLQVVTEGKKIVLSQCSYRSSDWKRLLEVLKEYSASFKDHTKKDNH